MKTIVPAVMLCCLLPGVSRGDSAVFGVGNESCGRWLEVRRDDNDLASSYIHWVSGWVSASTHDSALRFNKTDIESMAAFTDKYCRENPRSSIAEAANDLVEALKLHGKWAPRAHENK